MLDFSLPGKSLFSTPKAPELPPEPPPPPTREDPDALAAAREARMQERKKRGRRAMILSGREEDQLGAVGGVARPQAAAATLG